jgi:hypothetical protein
MGAVLHANVLNSWKEISTYVGRGVRTVQRWEKWFSFPVHRPSGHAKGSVLALPEEVDAWLQRNLSSKKAESAVSSAPSHVQDQVLRFHAGVNIFRQRYDFLQNRSRQLAIHIENTRRLREILHENTQRARGVRSKLIGSYSD